jgi:hypothetical protein
VRSATTPAGWYGLRKCWLMLCQIGPVHGNLFLGGDTRWSCQWLHSPSSGPVNFEAKLVLAWRVYAKEPRFMYSDDMCLSWDGELLLQSANTHQAFKMVIRGSEIGPHKLVHATEPFMVPRAGHV